MVWWTSPTPWESEFPFPGSRTSTFIHTHTRRPAAGTLRSLGRPLACFPPRYSLHSPMVSYPVVSCFVEFLLTAVHTFFFFFTSVQDHCQNTIEHTGFPLRYAFPKHFPLLCVRRSTAVHCHSQNRSTLNTMLIVVSPCAPWTASAGSERIAVERTWQK